MLMKCGKSLSTDLALRPPLYRLVFSLWFGEKMAALRQIKNHLRRSCVQINYITQPIDPFIFSYEQAISRSEKPPTHRALIGDL